MKEIIWLGSSYRDLSAFSDEAKQVAGYNLDQLQRGANPRDWKPMVSVGWGVRELRIHCENEYRVIYFANRAEGVYVLHSFVKKTEKTNLKDIELARKRFREIPGCK